MLWSCQAKQEKTDEPEQSTKVEEFREKVIDVHNEAMPLMTDIYQLKSNLKTQLADSTALKDERKQQLKDVIARLDSADKGMKVWMREFSSLETGGMSDEEAMKLLETEMTKIYKVKEDMFSSVAAAKPLRKE
jgi:chromosome segregation ATPase